MVGDITMLLNAIDSEDPKAAAELVPLVYEELRRLAAHKMAAERSDHTPRFPRSTGPMLDGGQPEILTSRIAHDA
jgi:hypothetical protein